MELLHSSFKCWSERSQCRWSPSEVSRILRIVIGGLLVTRWVWIHAWMLSKDGRRVAASGPRGGRRIVGILGRWTAVSHNLLVLTMMIGTERSRSGLLVKSYLGCWCPIIARMGGRCDLHPLIGRSPRISLLFRSSFSDHLWLCPLWYESLGGLQRCHLLFFFRSGSGGCRRWYQKRLFWRKFWLWGHSCGQCHSLRDCPVRTVCEQDLLRDLVWHSQQLGGLD